ncbi:MAG: hypothetical protein A2X28_00905 [Elusimicrobia bacterium GWA2_56_46]|nr:MAG: hypothetical protein A2X28_00905 [Elusimicrobia bacterium GWA2_56_46]OGR55923.1 MAG: hypothetical protein A2X39_06270 [Elusimicrobia bacterium GWC2_56_31]HBB67505.1 hypothetical protein [Elusimicrobiota bacterium]
MFIYRIVKALKAGRVKFAIAGGYAVALYGAVRGTVDLDLVLEISRDNYKSAEEALNGAGLVSRLPVNAEQIFAFRGEYIKNKNLIAWSFWNPANPAEAVDLIITDNLKNFKTTVVKAGGLELPLISRADLIRMKRKSGRQQDLEDVKALEALE